MHTHTFLFFWFLSHTVLLYLTTSSLLSLCRLSELRTISNPLALGPSDRRVERLLKTINLQPSLPKAITKVPTTIFLSKTGEMTKPGCLHLAMLEITILEKFMYFFLFFFPTLACHSIPPLSLLCPQWWRRCGSSGRCFSCCRRWSYPCWTASWRLRPGGPSPTSRLPPCSCCRATTRTWSSPTPAWTVSCPRPPTFPS